MNLIICTSPLQILIAEKIIERHSNEAFFSVVIADTFNAKYLQYYERLRKVSRKALLTQDKQGVLFRLLYHCLFRAGHIDKVFLASINKQLLHRLLELIRPREIYTFDDGTANIVSTGFFNQEDAPRRLGILHKLMGLHASDLYNTSRIKSMSLKHYTIYPGLKNIVSPTEVINLFDNASPEGLTDDTPVKVLLGQALTYDDTDLNERLAEWVIRKFDIDLYLPHPKEWYKVSGVEYIDTPLIFEDYYSRYLAHRPCTIYTFCSSAAFNILANRHKTQIIALKPWLVTNPSLLECYERFKEAGVTTIDVSEADLNTPT